MRGCYRHLNGIPLLLSCALLVIAVAGCKEPFELPVLDAGSVPAEIREGYSELKSDIVWRIYERTKTREFEVYTFRFVWDQEKQDRFHLLAAWFGEDGAMLCSSGGSGDLKSFWCGTQGGEVYDPSQKKAVRHLTAYGCALNRRVSTIIGITTMGRRVETEVLCGFWALYVQPAARDEDWVSLTAMSDDGSVVHRYPPKGSPRL